MINEILGAILICTSSETSEYRILLHEMTRFRAKISLTLRLSLNFVHAMLLEVFVIHKQVSRKQLPQMHVTCNIYEQQRLPVILTQRNYISQ